MRIHLRRFAYEEKNQIAYIAEAALEYFISLLITNAFLASLLSKNGVSDASVGIITQLASLAFTAQLFSIFYKKTSGFKKFVTIMHILNQLMFVLVYLVPGMPLPQNVKVILLVCFFLGGHLLANIVSPYKISWLMGYVSDFSRGKFTANKEIISLVGGIVFSFIMGDISDKYEAAGKDNVAFMICGITIFVLAVLHTISLLLVKEMPEDEGHKLPGSLETLTIGGVINNFKAALGNKVIMKLILVDVLWHLATGIAISFYGTYQNNELGFTLTFIAFLSFVNSAVRVAFSRFFGKFADKYSWTKMLNICFVIASGAFLVNIFASPHGFSFDVFGMKITSAMLVFILYNCLYGASMAGINSGLMNIIFDFVPKEERPAALGIKYSFGGLAAFAAALGGSTVLKAVQQNGNKLLGMNMYAQQILSVIAFIICLVLLVYMKAVVSKISAGKKENQ